MKTIVICSSASFYEQVSAVRDELEQRGYTVVVPKSVDRMRNNDNFKRADYIDDFKQHKTDLMRAHFDEIEKGDAVLVLNYTKDGKQHYIGGNVMAEMAVAFHLHIPIYVLNELPEYVLYHDELVGFAPVILSNDLTSLPKAS